MQRLLKSSGIGISVNHLKNEKEEVVIIAPGFFQSKETKTFKNIAKDLLNSFDVISMDFRGHGKSGGLYTFSAKEADDLKTVIDYARTLYPAVGVLGFSYGGTIAILEAARNKNIDSLICVSSPMASDEVEFVWWTPDAIKLGLKGLEFGAGVRPGNPYLKKTRAIDAVASIASLPILFIHGTKDPTVNLRHSEMMHQRVMSAKKLKIFKDGSHAEEIYRQFPKQFIDEIKNWFFDTLKNKGGYYEKLPTLS